MTQKQTTTLEIKACNNLVNCDIDFLVEEDYEVEIFDILLEGNSLMHPALLMTEEEIESVAQKLYEVYS